MFSKKSKSATVTDLTQGVIWKQLVLFALPFLFSNLLQTFYNAADMIDVGMGEQYPFDAELVLINKLVDLCIFVGGLCCGINNGAFFGGFVPDDITIDAEMVECDLFDKHGI